MSQLCRHIGRMGQSAAVGDRTAGVCLLCWRILGLHTPLAPWGKWFIGPVHSFVARAFPSWEGYYLA